MMTAALQEEMEQLVAGDRVLWLITQYPATLIRLEWLSDNKYEKLVTWMFQVTIIGFGLLSRA